LAGDFFRDSFCLQDVTEQATVLLRMRSGEFANHGAGRAEELAFRSSRTYVQMRPVFVFFLTGASTGTGVL
jgi:hypothetical protein